jgi:hypothetical protein
MKEKKKFVTERERKRGKETEMVPHELSVCERAEDKKEKWG